MHFDNKRIVISKTNRLGDMIVGLPVAGLLKAHAPTCHVTYLVTSYTKPIAAQSKFVDEVICWDDERVQKDPVACLKTLNADVFIHLRGQKSIANAAKKAKIPTRIGAVNRLYHWLTCNRWVFVNRNKHATLHDAQLDSRYILPFTKQSPPELNELQAYFQFNDFNAALPEIALAHPNKFNLIIHPKTMTHANKREWPLSYFAEVIEALDPERFQIFITGTEAEGQQMRELVTLPHVIDLTGKLSLEQLATLIQRADGLLAGSTGPLHLASALGIHTLGLYTKLKGHDPQRWGPIGKNADYLTPDADCRHCSPKKACDCIKSIKPNQVINKITTWLTLEKKDAILR